MSEDGASVIARSADFQLAAIAGELTKYRYRYNGEIQLQDGMQNVLEQAGYLVLREHVLGVRRQRSDLWIDGLVVEVKVDGSLAAALRQVSDYVNYPALKDGACESKPG